MKRNDLVTELDRLTNELNDLIASDLMRVNLPDESLTFAMIARDALRAAARNLTERKK